MSHVACCMSHVDALGELTQVALENLTVDAAVLEARLAALEKVAPYDASDGPDPKRQRAGAWPACRVSYQAIGQPGMYRSNGSSAMQH